MLHIEFTYIEFEIVKMKKNLKERKKWKRNWAEKKVYSAYVFSLAERKIQAHVVLMLTSIFGGGGGFGDFGASIGGRSPAFLFV